MAIVRVIVFDEEHYFQRISSPEDTFLVEAIDASGSDENIIKIGYMSASAVHIGHDNIHTFVSGVLSGNFITGTFYGDGSELDYVVHSLNNLEGNLTLVPGTSNVTITSGTDGTIAISASLSGADLDEKVKVSANDTTADYLYDKLVAGPNITITEQDDGGNEKVVISASVEGDQGSGKRFGWSVVPHQNGFIYFLGWNVLTDLSASITTEQSLVTSEPGYNSHFIFDVHSSSIFPFTMHLSGVIVDEATGNYTGYDEFVAISSSGRYQSVSSFMDAVNFYIEDSSVVCTASIYRNTYWDHGNQDFTVTGCRVEWTPDQPSWEFGGIIYHVCNDGSVDEIDNFYFYYTDDPPRAGAYQPGKYKRTDYNTVVSGSNNEGVIVYIPDQKAVREFYFEVKYED